MSTRLRQLQLAAVRAATAGQRLVGPPANSDVTGGCGLAVPAVGLAPPYGIFPQQPALPMTLKDVFSDCEAHNAEILASLKALMTTSS